MKKVKKVIAILLLLMAFGVTAHAKEELYSSQKPYDPVGKLFRGVSTILESPLEFGCHTREPAPFHQSTTEYTGSVLKAGAMTVRRILIGAFQTVTFIFPGEFQIDPYCETYYSLPV